MDEIEVGGCKIFLHHSSSQLGHAGTKLCATEHSAVRLLFLIVKYFYILDDGNED